MRRPSSTESFRPSDHFTASAMCVVRSITYTLHHIPTHTRTRSRTCTHTWEREDRRQQERRKEKGMFLSFRSWVSGDSKHLHRYLPSIYVNRCLGSLTCPTNWTVQVIYPLSTVVCRGPTSQWLLFEIIRWSVYRLKNMGTTTCMCVCVCA